VQRAHATLDMVFIQELIEAFDRAEIRYCIVGGVAMNLHGVPRMTYDVEDVQNLERIRGKTHHG
jgi:hypothetical protein